MAQTADVTQRLDLHLLAVEDLLNELAEVAATWDQLPESEQAAWSLDWDQAMARLRLLDRAARAGEMSLAQRQRYRVLLKRLCQALPALEQLNLQRPPVSVEP
jgi:hypothetical protein